jgi:tetratricopeptide (TPR) repeat protein
LEGLGRHEEADAAFAETWRRAEHTTEAVRKRLRWAVGFAISKRLPTLAREHFHAVLQADPLNSQALYGQGMLIVEEAQTLSKEEKRVREEAALTYFQRAVNVAPQFADARRARATLLARLGMLEEATRDVNWCLERDAREGANLYTAACVAALAVPAGDAPATRMARREALDFLQRALKSGYGFEQLQNDPDLASLRDDPEFQQLVANHALNRPAAKQD